MSPGIDTQPLVPTSKKHRFQGSEPVGCLRKGMEALRQAVGQRECVEAGL